MFIGCSLEFSKSLYNTNGDNKRNFNLFFAQDSQGGFNAISAPFKLSFHSNSIVPNEPTSLMGFGSITRRFLPPNYSDLGNNGGSYCRPFKTIEEPPRVKSLLIQGTQQDGSLGYFLTLSYDYAAIPVDFNVKIMRVIQASFPSFGFSNINTNIVATHTHSGAAGISENQFWAIAVCDLYNKSYFDLVQNITISTINEALQSLQVVDSVDIAINDIDGFNYSRVAGMDVDKNSFYANFKNSLGNSIGCMDIFSVHSTWFGISSLTLSSDLAGYLESGFQSLTGANTCIFFNGTVGNASYINNTTNNTPSNYATNFVTATQRSISYNLASPQQIRFGSVFVTLPNFQINYNSCINDIGIPYSVLDKLITIDSSGITNNITKISWFSLDNTLFFFFPGEPLYDVKQYLQSYIQGYFPSIKNVFFISVANDHAGYVMMPPNYSTPGLETCSTLHGPNTGPVLLNQFIQALQNSNMF